MIKSELLINCLGERPAVKPASFLWRVLQSLQEEYCLCPDCVMTT